MTVGFDDVDDEVYNFVNLVMQYFTGTMGIFGTQIAFVGRGSNGLKQIYTMTMDGSAMGSVTSNSAINVLPAWGPGGQVMYTSFVNGNPDLFLGNNNASTLSSRSGMNTGAALSPGGGEIAVTLSKDGNSEIYILDTAGEIVRRCTNNASEDVSPAWSPDGSQIAFVSDRSGGPQIYVMNADCSGQRRVTFAGNYNTTPDWSPNGDLIAFTGRDSRNRFDIFTVEPVSGFITRLTQDQGNNEEPSFSPDGNYIAFSSTRGGGGSRIYIMTARRSVSDRNHHERQRLRTAGVGEVNMKTTRLFALLAVLAFGALFIACPKPPGPDALDSAQAAIDEAADSERCAEAEYRAAQNLMAQARAAYEEGDYDRSQQLALAAQEQAQRAREVAERNREECDRVEGLDEALADRDSQSGRDVSAGRDWTNYILERVFFEFNVSTLTEDSRVLLESHAAYLLANPDLDIQIQGHCDERGSTEYNLALGERRARAVRDYLVRLGVPTERMSTVSYGEEMPLGTDNNRNRRAEFVER